MTCEGEFLKVDRARMSPRHLGAPRPVAAPRPARPAVLCPSWLYLAGHAMHPWREDRVSGALPTDRVEGAAGAPSSW
jgi:hypothetical protein